MKLNIKNETGKLKSVVLGQPKSMGPIPTLEESYDAKSYHSIEHNIYPKEEDIISEVSAFEAVLKKYDVEVLRPAIIKDYNQVFARDVAFVIEDKMIISNVIKDREDEQEAYRKIFEKVEWRKIINLPETAHIEGGEVSGTVDELIRHSVSKLSHIHFVSNTEAAQRLQQMGEIKESIFTIGSPDIDIMFSEQLPDLAVAKSYYQLDFEAYAIAMFHPVTTEIDQMEVYAQNFVDALLADHHNYLVVYPNNDLGSRLILKAYEALNGNPRFRVIPSLRFEYFLTLLKNSQFIIGNSSAGIREAPYYGIPIINIGTRQQNRAVHADILHVDYQKAAIGAALDMIDIHKI